MWVRYRWKYRYFFGWYRKNIHFLDIIWISYRYDIQLFWISFRYHRSKLYRYDIENYIDMISKKYRKNDIRYRWYRFQKYRKNIHFFRYFLDIISISKNRYHPRYRFQKYRKNILFCRYHLDIISIYQNRYHPWYRPRKYPRKMSWRCIPSVEMRKRRLFPTLKLRSCTAASTYVNRVFAVVIFWTRKKVLFVKPFQFLCMNSSISSAIWA